MPCDVLEQAAGANLLIITRPNAPTGNTFPKEDIRKIASEFNGKTEWVQRSDWYPKNSFHYENGGCSFLTREEIAFIVNYCRERGFEIIPEVPSLSHTDYLLYNHPELAEIPGDAVSAGLSPKAVSNT